MRRGQVDGEDEQEYEAESLGKTSGQECLKSPKRGRLT